MIRGFPLQQGPVFTKEQSFATLQKAGLDKIGLDVLPKSAYVVSEIAISAVSYNAKTKIYNLTIPSHLAVKHNFIRFVDGSEEGNESPIFAVVDANVIQVYGDSHLTNPQVGDVVQVLRYVTPAVDADGNISISMTTAPTQYILDGSDQQVIEDTATPANNRAMPSMMFIKKDGVSVPVNKDTGTPANTTAIPVEIVSASGTNINITAGDLDVHSTHLGVNFDSLRIGDGSEILEINADGSINAVVALPTGAATEAKQDDGIDQLIDINAELDGQTLFLDSIDTTLDAIANIDFATEAKQDAAIVHLAAIEAATEATATALAGGGLATEAKQDAAIVHLAAIETAAEAIQAVDFATEAKQDVANAALGTPADAAVTDFTLSASVIAALKGLASLLTDANTNLVNLNDAGSASFDSTSTNAVNGVTTFTPPAGAKLMIVQNSSADGVGPIRFTSGSGTPTSSSGYYLGVGQSTSTLPAGTVKAIKADVDNGDVTVAWFV